MAGVGPIGRTHESDEASSSGNLDETTASSRADASGAADPEDPAAPVDDGDEPGQAGAGDAASAGADAGTAADRGAARGPDERRPVEWDEASDDGRRLLCWVCRRPLDPAESVYWRGEPVHPDCR